MLSNAAMQSFALLETAITMAVIVSWGIRAWFFSGRGGLGNLRDSRSPLLRLFICALLANLFFWPIYGLPLELPLAAYVRGFTGELSMTAMLLLWTAYFSKEVTHTPVFIKAWIALLAIAFYPFALGVGMLDPYMWGYGSWGLLAGVLLTALVAWLVGSNRITLILALAIVAWAVGWHESSNLWDYVLDPFLGIWAIGSVLRSLMQARAGRAQAGYLFRRG